jgi:signal transduction histidine kinase
MAPVTPDLPAVLLEPISRRARLELLWCGLGLLTAAAVVGLVTAVVTIGTATGLDAAFTVPVLLIVALVLVGARRPIGTAYRALASRLLDVQVDRRDASAWRTAAYVLVKVPFTVLHEYALLWWIGVVNLTYPFWWGLFRNHDPGVRLDPVIAITPFGFLRIRTLPGTLLVFAAGALMVLAAPWVTRAVTAADRWLLVNLLGPGPTALRVRQLEASRAHVVDDAASTLRRIERDLHDGAQAQLATLAMKLGQATEKLRHDAAVPFDPDSARELVDDAHVQAKAALAELRNIARGIHPPALDVGLDAALATLVARSPVPATLEVTTDIRPTKAIEAIAYFSAAELLANVARHSGAHRATVEVTGRNGRLRLAVHDDGAGGARIGAGTGLSGLADRVQAVDGRLDVSSPAGGPTVVVVELPVQA